MFKKKKKREAPVIEQKPITFEFKCPHTWQDFDWYIKSQYGNNTVTIQLYEPYVCISCKERMDKLLEQKTFPNIKSLAEAEQIIKSYVEQYGGRIKPKPIVEDQVNDFQFIDRHFLEVVKRIYHLPEVETSDIDFKEATFYNEKQFTEPSGEVKYTSSDKILGFDSEGCGPTSCTNLLLGALAKKSNCEAHDRALEWHP